ARRPVIKQITKAAGTSFVVSSFFVSQQQTGILCAALGRGKSPLGVEQNRTGVRGENFGDQRFEFFHHRVGDVAAFFLSQRFLQRAALVHRRGRDNAAFVRYAFK